MGSSLALRDPEGVMLAAIEVQEMYRPDREQEAKAVYGTDNPEQAGSRGCIRIKDRM